MVRFKGTSGSLSGDNDSPSPGGEGRGEGERAFQFQVVFLHRLNTAYATAVSRIAAPFANTAFACATAFSAVNPYFCLR